VPNGRGNAKDSSWQLLRHRDFCRYFFGSLVSNLGTWLQNTAQVLLAYQFTRSVFTVGVIAAAQFAGTLVLSPWAAVIADRIGHKATLVGTQVSSALIAAAMAWLYVHGMLSEAMLGLGALGLGFAFALALPVQIAMVPTLVDAGESEAAMEMNSVSYNAGRALAPALCVLAMTFIGPALVFATNAASFAVFALVLVRLKPAHPRWNKPPQPTRDQFQQERRVGVGDGLRMAIHENHLRLLLLLAIVAAVTIGDDPVLVLSPALAGTVLHLSSNWAGFFIAALGWGTVMGSLPPTSRRRVEVQELRKYAPSRRAARSLLVLAAAVIVFALGISTPISLLAAFVAGAAALRTGAAAQTAIITRNRKAAASIAALWVIAWAGTKPIASLLDGSLASFFSGLVGNRLGIALTAATLATPAIAIGMGELCISDSGKRRIKRWARRTWPVQNLGRDPASGNVAGVQDPSAVSSAPGGGIGSAGGSQQATAVPVDATLRTRAHGGIAHDRPFAEPGHVSAWKPLTSETAARSYVVLRDPDMNDRENGSHDAK
jgi:MFS family permease